MKQMPREDVWDLCIKMADSKENIIATTMDYTNIFE